MGRRLFFSPFYFKASAGRGYMTSWNQCRFLMMHEMKYCCPVHSEYSEFCSVIDPSCAALTGQKRPPQQLQLCPAPQPAFCVDEFHLLLLHSLLQAHTAGSQFSSFRQGVNRKHFPCRGSCFGKQKKRKSQEPYRISKQPHIIWDLRNSGLIICKW